MLNLIIALGALVGAADCVTGNRLRLGDKFEEGFLHGAHGPQHGGGIICLAPLFGKSMRRRDCPAVSVLWD